MIDFSVVGQDRNSWRLPARMVHLISINWNLLLGPGCYFIFIFIIFFFYSVSRFGTSKNADWFARCARAPDLKICKNTRDCEEARPHFWRVLYFFINKQTLREIRIRLRCARVLNATRLSLVSRLFKCLWFCTPFNIQLWTRLNYKVWHALWCDAIHLFGPEGFLFFFPIDISNSRKSTGQVTVCRNRLKLRSLTWSGPVMKMMSTKRLRTQASRRIESTVEV